MIQLLLVLTALSQFSGHLALAEPMSCKKLDYDSYFIAQNAKENLKRENPDVSHPNFDQKYLLLKNEMLMETLYLIADCETGKFFHEKLSGSVQFNLTSPEVSVKQEHEALETQMWNGSGWTKVERAPEETGTGTQTSTSTQASTSTLTKTAKPDLLTAYAALFEKYPSKESLPTCHAVDLESSFRVQASKDSILKDNGDLSKPTFAGAYLFLKNELLFENQFLLVDCKTGKFVGEPSKGSMARFKPASRLLILEHSGNFPELFLFDGVDRFQIPDPIQNKSVSISNSFSGPLALALFHALPNPSHLQTLHFENLEKTSATTEVFNHLQASTILSGKCVEDQKKYSCETKTK